MVTRREREIEDVANRVFNGYEGLMGTAEGRREAVRALLRDPQIAVKMGYGSALEDLDGCKTLSEAKEVIWRIVDYYYWWKSVDETRRYFEWEDEVDSKEFWRY